KGVRRPPCLSSRRPDMIVKTYASSEALSMNRGMTRGRPRGEEEMTMKQSRREFLRAAPASALTAAALASDERAWSASRGAFGGKLCFFSKHLPEADWSELARLVKQMGFDGVDLTVRKEGHVLPENAARDLPRAVSAIREEGLEVPMITTE